MFQSDSSTPNDTGIISFPEPSCDGLREGRNLDAASYLKALAAVVPPESFRRQYTFGQRYSGADI
jgi:hypothetical protein